jgi:hypothetical protein
VLSAQVLGEAWSLCTRPANLRGGYGLTIEETEAMISDIRELAVLLPEPPHLWAEQSRLLVSHRVSGVQTHDCRIAAWCRLSQVEGILTLNPKGFNRFGITTLNPTEAATGH